MSVYREPARGGARGFLFSKFSGKRGKVRKNCSSGLQVDGEDGLSAESGREK